MADDAKEEVSLKIHCFCGQSEELKACARCKSVFYCGRQHQIQDWPKHKKVCKAKQAEIAKKAQNVTTTPQAPPLKADEKSVTPLSPVPKDEQTTPKFDDRPLKLENFPQPKSLDVENLPEFVSIQLMEKGYCVVDGLLSADKCDMLLAEAKQLEKSGKMNTGGFRNGSMTTQE